MPPWTMLRVSPRCCARREACRLVGVARFPGALFPSRGTCRPSRGQMPFGFGAHDQATMRRKMRESGPHAERRICALLRDRRRREEPWLRRRAVQRDRARGRAGSSLRRTRAGRPQYGHPRRKRPRWRDVFLDLASARRYLSASPLHGGPAAASTRSPSVGLDLYTCSPLEAGLSSTTFRARFDTRSRTKHETYYAPEVWPDWHCRLDCRPL